MENIFLDNCNNSSENNPPGYNIWVGGDKPNGSVGIKVLKVDTHVKYILDKETEYLQTWYYDYGWCSGSNIEGPFENNKVYKLDKVVGN